MPRHADNEIVHADRVTMKKRTASGRVQWVDDWQAYATVTSLGANGPFDTKREAKAALRRELRGIIEDAIAIEARRAELYGRP